MKNLKNILKNNKVFEPLIFIISAIILWSILYAIEKLLTSQEIINFNLDILENIRSFRTPKLGEAFLFITLLGKDYVVTLGTVFLSVVLALYRKWHSLLTIVVSIATGQLLITFAKNIFQTVRPPFESALITENTYSFPSGHTFAAVIFYGLLTYLLLRISKKTWQKILILSGGFLVVISVAFSRVFIGAHWPTDVLTSFAAGTTWLAFSIISLEIGERAELDSKKKALLNSKKIKMVGLVLFILWLAVLVYLGFKRLF